MTDRRFELTRRKALIGLGSIGLAGAGAGVGTSALFSDDETFEDNSITAGELDLTVHYDTSVSQDGVSTGSTTGSGTINGDPAIDQYVINDVKPGDSGKLEFCFSIVDNPAYLFMRGNLTADDENGTNDPEDAAAAENDIDYFGQGSGELAGAIQAKLGYCESGEDILDEDIITKGSLGGVLADLHYGLALNGAGDPGEGVVDRTEFPASSDSADTKGPCVCLEWELPATVTNEVQSDSVEFDLAFEAEQARHNDGSGMWTVVTGNSPITGSQLNTAISNAAPGDTLLLADDVDLGEKVTIDKELNLRGEGQLVRFQDTSSPAKEPNTAVDADDVYRAFEVAADNVRVGNLVINGAGDGSGNAPRAIFASGQSNVMYSNVSAKNVGPTKNKAKALVITGGSDHSLLRELYATGAGNDGVTHWNSDYCWAEEITATENEDNGIYFNGLGHTLMNSTALNNTDQGVDVGNEYDNRDPAGGMVVNRVYSRNNDNGGIELEYEGGSAEDDGAVQVVKNCTTSGNEATPASGNTVDAGLIINGDSNDGSDPDFDVDDIEVLSNNDFQDGVVVSNGTDFVDQGTD